MFFFFFFTFKEINHTKNPQLSNDGMAKVCGHKVKNKIGKVQDQVGGPTRAKLTRLKYRLLQRQMFVAKRVMISLPIRPPTVPDLPRQDARVLCKRTQERVRSTDHLKILIIKELQLLQLKPENSSRPGTLKMSLAHSQG